MINGVRSLLLWQHTVGAIPPEPSNPQLKPQAPVLSRKQKKAAADAEAAVLIVETSPLMLPVVARPN